MKYQPPPHLAAARRNHYELLMVRASLRADRTVLRGASATLAAWMVGEGVINSASRTLTGSQLPPVIGHFVCQQQAALPGH